jgi:hypothetical protein
VTTIRHPTVQRALDVLLSSELEPIVELVVRRAGDHTYEALAVDGRSVFRRRDEGTGWAFDVLEVDGRDPLGSQDVSCFAGSAAELAAQFPRRDANSYPFAHEQVAQVFDCDHAPDLVVLHTAAHHWADQGGHIGEHGSMDVVQARAPFVLGGKGVRRLGRQDRAVRLTDVAPTLAALLGLPEVGGVGLNGTWRDDARLARQDGDAMVDVLDLTDPPDHVFAFLLDGVNANVLHDAIDAGDVPNLARIADMGMTFGHGAFSSLPTVTLANHTTALTGCHPGHHGILHNAWWDRAGQHQIITNDASQWAVSMQHLRPGIETLHEAIRRVDPAAFTVSINEPCDRGAVYSTFELMRNGVRMGFPKTPEGLPHTTERFVRPFKDYGWYSQIDHHGLEQALGVLGGVYLGTDHPALPRFCWMNITVTDSAFHDGGPHSEVALGSLVDTDGRVGEILGLLERRGVLDRCAFALLADHGMEESDPRVTGDWDAALAAAGIDFRDEAYGFVYLEPGSPTRLV